MGFDLFPSVTSFHSHEKRRVSYLVYMRSGTLFSITTEVEEENDDDGAEHVDISQAYREGTYATVVLVSFFFLFAFCLILLRLSNSYRVGQRETGNPFSQNKSTRE